MTVLWGRVVAAVFAITVLILFVKHWHAIVGFLKTTEHIGSEYSRREQTVGMVAFGLICILIVALVKILTTNKGG